MTDEISIHALREEGDFPLGRYEHRDDISIHALREEGDGMPLGVEPSQQISIHALREEGDVDQAYRLTLLELFLSTPSARRATFSIMPMSLTLRFLSTPSARRATGTVQPRAMHRPISIHALREEGDILWHSGTKAGRDFYPRPPRGGRPALGHRHRRAAMISIHALREEGDHIGRTTYYHKELISIHALREEGDPPFLQFFQCRTRISIHALREEGDVSLRKIIRSSMISIHALREEGDAGNAAQKAAGH